jgi:hypothetical protein
MIGGEVFAHPVLLVILAFEKLKIAFKDFGWHFGYIFDF